MPVFKSAMKVARRQMGLIIMYIVIVIFVLTMNMSHSSNPQDTGYQSVKLSINLADQDNSPLSHGLRDFLAHTHTVTDCSYDPSRLQEDLYYREAEYVLRIPAGFGQDPVGHPLQGTEVPGSYTGFYLNSQIQGFVRLVRLYEAGGFSQADAISMAGESVETSVNMAAGKTDSTLSTGIFFQFIPYGALCVLCYIIGNVFCAFLSQEIRKRTDASAITRRQQECQLLLSVTVFGLAVYGILLIMGTAFFGFRFWSAPNLGLNLLNMALMVLVCMSISYAVAMVAKTPESLSGIVNSISLGMGFLCGVFVPLDLLGRGVQSVAKFLPLYWYEHASSLCHSQQVLSAAQRADYWQSMGIQLLFVIALLAIGSHLHKKRI